MYVSVCLCDSYSLRLPVNVQLVLKKKHIPTVNVVFDSKRNLEWPLQIRLTKSIKLTRDSFTGVMNPVVAGWTLNHLCVLHVVIIALVADGAEVAWEITKSHNNVNNTWAPHVTSCLPTLPFLWRRVQSGHRSSSWFQAKSQVFPGVTPQLLHRMHVMHTYKWCEKHQTTFIVSCKMVQIKNQAHEESWIVLTDETWASLS